MRLTLPFFLLALLFTSGCEWSRATTAGEAAAIKNLDKAQTEAEAKQKAADQATNRADTAKNASIAQAASNLGPLATAVAVQGQPDLGAGIGEQKRAIDSALSIPVSQYPTPTVTLEQLLKDAKGALATYQTKNADLQQKLDTEKAAAERAVAEAAAAKKEKEAAEAVAKAEKAKADAEASKAWWWSFGGTLAGVVAAAAGLATRLGLPGAGLVETAMSFVTPALSRKAAETAQKASVATTATAAADVGRSALQILDLAVQQDPDLAGKLTGAVSKLTGGRAEGVEDLFKLAAKTFVLDNVGGHAGHVDALLTKIRGEVLPTAGGVPKALDAILKA